MSLADFNEVWCVGVAGSSPPGPLCLVAREQRSGRLVRLRGDELANLRAAPFPTDSRSLLVAYGAAEVLAVFHAHGWAPPHRTLDLFFEFRAATNGLPTPHGTGLLGALAYHGLSVLPAGRSEVGGNADGLGDCGAVADALVGLLRAMLPNIDVPRALLRGRYAWAVAAMQHRGIPIDVPTYVHLRQTWPATRARLIADVDGRYGVYDGGTFRRERFDRFLTDRGIPWPRLPSGELDCSADTFRTQARAHTAVAELRELRSTLAQMKLFDRLAVGPDGRNRTDLMPFASKTGRNQPSSAEYIFGPSRWIRSLIQPAPGMAVAYLDFVCQEIAVAAALSGDSGMLEACSSGDFYLAFAQRAGAVPADATKATHAEVRAVYKAVALGVMYGMGAESLAQRIGRPRAVAEDLLAQHKRAFPGFWAWSQAVVDHALLTGQITTVFGWPLRISPGSSEAVNTRSVANFPIQANAAEMLRLACCLLVESGVGVCGPVHDAVLIEAPADDIEAVVGRAKRLMAEASQVVLNGFAVGVDAKIVRHPGRYMDDAGAEFWATVIRLTGSSQPVHRRYRNRYQTGSTVSVSSMGLLLSPKGKP